jgi:chemotaxis protein CheY-P-specific phosphatase CheC
MPVMDGYEVLQTVQQQDLPALIIVVSGDIQIKAHERVKALGALDFIQKPVSADAISHILQEYGILTLTQGASADMNPMMKVDLRDACQEIANVAMGRAADLLAKLLDVFVVLPIPNVNVLEVSELTMALKATEESSTISALCQGFIGAGVAGEALLLFHDASFEDMAKLMNLNSEDETEVLIDTGNVLVGAFLSGVSEQLDMKFSQSHPVVLGRHCTVNDLIHASSDKWRRTLAMEINYRIEDYNIQCDLLLLFTEDSIPTLNFKLGYLLD